MSKSTSHPSKHFMHGDPMLQCPIISTIVVKDLNWKLGIIRTFNNICTQVTMNLMQGVMAPRRPLNCPPCVSLHIHSMYQRVLPILPNNVQTTIKKHTWLSEKCHISMLGLFRLLIHPCFSSRWVDLHTYAHSIDIHIFNHMEVRGGCQIEPQTSLPKNMANIMGARR
jgi:hypothetical protein